MISSTAQEEDWFKIDLQSLTNPTLGTPAMIRLTALSQNSDKDPVEGRRRVLNSLDKGPLGRYTV